MMQQPDLVQRARSFALASMFSAYPDLEFEQSLPALSHSLQDHEGIGPLMRWLSEHGADLDLLRSHHLDLFERGKARVSLYETEYGRMRGSRKGVCLADIAGFYRAFSLELADGEMLDHVAVELEFYATLLMKHAELEALGDDEGVFVVSDAMRKFLEAHLGTFVDALAGQVAERGDRVYATLFGWIAHLLRGECLLMHAKVEPLDYFDDGGLADEPRCAESAAPWRGSP